MKYIFLIVIACFLDSCLKVDCEELEKLKRTQECIIVVNVPPEKSVWFYTKGYNPVTKKECECKSSNRWWSLFSSEINKGDTIIKKRGELSFNIHKKDTIITHYWQCNGKEYK